MFGIAELVDRLILRSRREPTAWIRAEANKLVGDFGLDAYFEARRREREANDLEAARFWSRVALILAKATDKRLNSDARIRMAVDADCIRFLESYWPQSPSQPPELSQFEALRRIASDPGCGASGDDPRRSDLVGRRQNLVSRRGRLPRRVLDHADNNPIGFPFHSRRPAPKIPPR